MIWSDDPNKTGLLRVLFSEGVNLARFPLHILRKTNSIKAKQLVTTLLYTDAMLVFLQQVNVTKIQKIDKNC